MDNETTASELITPMNAKPEPKPEATAKPKPKPKAKSKATAKPKAKSKPKSKATAKPKAKSKATAKPRGKGMKSAIAPEKLIAALKTKPRTALELSKLFKRSAVSVKRQLAKMKGIRSKVRAPNGVVGRRPNVYSLAG